ncbi:hypothetical protein L226DRAFT_519333 [Lentinus tigrinus ALCF2SS1-7]|uniref:DUF7770 domain-containing protein n=1 Tax=Lentinus tigrinus ALCF2SS1-6 TaxID=1328759 RepID=A0A5C2SU88_9APHY|nr:hypothetical protein L227DRAFT_26737 [Lentinus tigrinus ALCF2SS1-6]RPD81441.1 hypothetical protein L226DRAFT_519333 [Lentinus tigrinus ALCF2SS1-7]
MTPPDHKIEPVIDNQAARFSTQPLKEVILWCTHSGMVHWMTSYRFPQMLEENIDGSRVFYEGVSFNMFQPQRHVYHRLPDENNLFGTLQVQARRMNALISSRPGLKLTTTFKDTVRVTVQDVLNVVTDAGHQYYKYSPVGSGCLCWQLQLLERFVTKGWLAREVVEKFAADIEAAAKERRSAIIWPPVQGTHYNESEVSNEPV